MKISLTDNDVANLVLQRTNAFLELGGQAALGHWFKTGEKAPLFNFLEKTGQTESFVNAVFAEVKNDFDALKPFLANSIKGPVVSIGPGLGYFEALVYSVTRSTLTLIDIEESTEHEHGFAKNGSGYSDLSSAQSFLRANGVEDSHIRTCNPRKESLPAEPFDILISLYSMGFHYPCDEYAEFILTGLKPGGVMIIDKRLNSADPGWDTLVPKFTVVETIPYPKSQRLVLSRR